MKHITCQDLLRYLSDFIDGQLDAEQTAVAEHHLATCQNCRTTLKTTQRTIDLLRNALRRPMPEARRLKLFSTLQQTFLNPDNL